MYFFTRVLNIFRFVKIRKSMQPDGNASVEWKLGRLLGYSWIDLHDRVENLIRRKMTQFTGGM